MVAVSDVFEASSYTLRDVSLQRPDVGEHVLVLQHVERVNSALFSGMDRDGRQVPTRWLIMARFAVLRSESTAAQCCWPFFVYWTSLPATQYERDRLSQMLLASGVNLDDLDDWDQETTPICVLAPRVVVARVERKQTAGRHPATRGALMATWARDSCAPFGLPSAENAAVAIERRALAINDVDPERAGAMLELAGRHLRDPGDGAEILRQYVEVCR